MTLDVVPAIDDSTLPSAADGRFLPNRVPVESRLLVSVAYDHDQLVLQLELRDGSLYQFFQVPCQTHQELLQADSKGAYFNRHVRNRFRYARLHPDSSVADRPTPLS